jgi:hypothetical protein
MLMFLRANGTVCFFANTCVINGVSELVFSVAISLWKTNKILVPSPDRLKFTLCHCSLGVTDCRHLLVNC